ncbi:MAG: glutaredoxin domain-containing protein [Nonlabens sp.]
MKTALTILFIVIASGVYSQSANEEKQSSSLVVYGVDDCHYCYDSKILLDENKVDYIFYNVDLNAEKRREMVEGLKKAGISLKSLKMPVIKK